MVVQLHSPALGIVTIAILISCYCVMFKLTKNDLIERLGYTLMFTASIFGVFIGGVAPFL